jgi:transposase
MADIVDYLSIKRVNYLPSVWLPDADTEALRHFCNDRRSLVDRRTELKNPVHAVLHRNLIPVSHSDLFGTGGQKCLQAIIADETDETSSSETPLDPIDRLRVRAFVAGN